MFHYLTICVLLMMMMSPIGQAGFLLDELSLSNDDAMERMSNQNVEGDSSTDVFGKSSNVQF